MIRKLFVVLLVTLWCAFWEPPAYAQSIGQTGTITISAVTANQGTANTAANKWPIEIVDSAGVNIAAVTAASALKVDGSAVTQPVSGTVTANAGTSAANPGWAVFVAPTSATANGLSNAVSAAVETGHVIKAAAGNLYAFNVTTGATAGMVLIHNSTTVPVAGAVTPVKCYQVGANQTVGGGWSPTPLAFSTGISISFSSATTCFTQTNSATAFISADFL